MTTTAAYNVPLAVKLIGNLCKEHNISLDELRSVFPARPTTEQECSAISKWIGQMIQERKVGRVVPITETAVPAPPSSPQVVAAAQANWKRKDKNGKNMPQFFAVDMDGKPHFFRVKPGYKAGVWFIEEQASDELYSVRQRDRRERILGLIFANEENARAMYGKLISRCSRCNRTLTDHDNPYFPVYGPECGGK